MRKRKVSFHISRFSLKKKKDSSNKNKTIAVNLVVLFKQSELTSIKVC